MKYSIYIIILSFLLFTGCGAEFSDSGIDQINEKNTVTQVLEKESEIPFLFVDAVICQPGIDYQEGLYHPLIADIPKLHQAIKDFLEVDAESFAKNYQNLDELFNIGIQYRLNYQNNSLEYFDMLDILLFGNNCTESVINNLYVGDPITKMISLFGKTHFIDEELNLYGYRFTNFYLICNGDKDIEEIIIIKYQAPSEEYQEIISYYLQQRHNNKYIPSSQIARQYPNYIFYYPCGFGENLLYSNGLLLTCDIIEDDIILVWNNYEGQIKTDQDNQVIQFIDQDYYFYQISQYYIRKNNLKDRRDGIASPNGNIIAYPRNAERPVEGDQINIRFLDNSHYDIDIMTSHAQSQLYWLSNRYLLYQVYLNQPYIYDIETNKAMALWLLSDLPIDYQYQDHGEAYYILKDENNLIWGTMETDDIFAIKYSFDKDGTIAFTYTLINKN